MSLLSREVLRVAFGPDRVDLVSIRQTWRGPAAGARQSMAAGPGGGGAAAWRPALDVLAAALPTAKGRAGSARLALSDQFVRYLLVQWRTDLRGVEEFEALARIRFREVYGSAADAWEVRLAPTGFGAPYVACAIDAELLLELREVFARQKLPLAAVRPVFISTYNLWRRTRHPGACWFAVYGGGRLSLCRIEDGVWRSLRTQKSGADMAQELQLAIVRESLNLCVEPRGAALHVFAPEQPRLSAGKLDGIDVSVLEPPPGLEARYAMALI